MTTAQSNADASGNLTAAPEDPSRAQADITTQMIFAVPPSRACEGLTRS